MKNQLVDDFLLTCSTHIKSTEGVSYQLSALSFTEFKKRVSCSIFTNLDACQVSGSRDAGPLVPLLCLCRCLFPLALPHRLGAVEESSVTTAVLVSLNCHCFFTLIGIFYILPPLGKFLENKQHVIFKCWIGSE